MKAKISFADLVAYIAKETGSSKNFVQAFLKEMAGVIEEGLNRDGVVHISGLGIFKLQLAAASVRKIPNSTEYKEIPAHYRVGFKPEKSLREFLNGKYAHLKPEPLVENPISAKPVLAAAAAAIPTSVIYNKSIESAAVPPKKKSNSNLYIGIAAVLIIAMASLYFFRSWGALGEQSGQLENTTVASQVIPESKALALSDHNPGKIYTVSQGDNLWSISNACYSRPYLWPNIYRANKKEIDNPDFLKIGVDLHIPALDGKNGELTAEDKTDIAEGYVQAYFTYKKLGKDTARYYLWAAKRFDSSVVETHKTQIDVLDLIEDEPINTASLAPGSIRF